MHNQSTMQKILFSYLIILFIIVSLIGITIFPSLLKEMNLNLENDISETAAILSTDTDIRTSISSGNFSDSLISRLDQIMKEKKKIDYIVIADASNIRLYHPNHTLIGKTFAGGDQSPILSGSQPYITNGIGNTQAQKRAFHQILDTNGKICGFVMVSASLEHIHHEEKALLLKFFTILLIVFFIGVIFSIFISKNIRKSLMGFEPRTFAKMYLQRDEILDTLDECIIAIDHNGQNLYRNPAADKFYSKETNLLKTVLSPPLETCFLEKTSRNGLMIEIGDDTFLVNLIPLIKENQCDGILIIARDKTELTQMAEQLTGMNHIIDALRANTHEYMNTLHVISGLLQIGEPKQALTYINKNASEIESGHRIIIRQIQNKTLAALIIGKLNRAKELSIQFIFQKGSSLESHNDFLSTRELVTIIGNLIENAFDALNDTEELREVELMIRSDTHGLTITVDDTGCGMTADQIQKIYAGPYTSKGNGHGYGLRLIQEIVHAHDGFFNIDSEPGEGSSISIVINKKRKIDHKEE